MAGHREIASAPHSRQVVRDNDYSWSMGVMMTLYSGTTCPYSHRCRFVFYEKQIDFQVIDVDIYAKVEDLKVINPYERVPVLVDRDLVLYETNIINEYVDERFPHPQLMPPDPVMRARARQLVFTMEQELFAHVDVLERKPQQKAADKARLQIRDRLVELVPIFAKQKFLLGDDLTMLDVAIAPLLWRLELYQIELPSSAVAPIMAYADNLFTRPGFVDALTPTEKTMRR